MFSLSRALLSTVTTWLVATLLIFARSAALGSWQAQQLPVAYLFRELMVAGYFTGIAVFPTCLLVVCPCLSRLPARSPLWRPGAASATGAVAGVTAAYLWVAAFRGKLFRPDLHDPAHLQLTVASVIAGITFALLYSRSPRSRQHPE